MERAVIHLNIADFAAAVETSLQPSLKGYPFVVAPQGTPRAMVYDMSEEAYRQGIRKGMPLSAAVRLNKKIKTLPPKFNRYERVMKDLLRHTAGFTPLVEHGAADGHIFMDVTHSGRLFGPPPDVAFRLKKTFKKLFGLDPVWSVAANKLVAKVATRIVKPCGEYIVAPGEEDALLSPLPVKLIPGILESDLKTMTDFNLYYVHQAKVLTLEQLGIPFDERAHSIYNRIRGIDSSPVTAWHACSSLIRADHEFASDTNRSDSLRKSLYQMADRICIRLRQKQMCCAAVNITISYSDGLQNSARRKLTPPVSDTMALFRKCADMLEKAWKRRVRVRHLNLVCEKIVSEPSQIDMFPADIQENRRKKLSGALDSIRSKFGKRAVSPALIFARESGIT